MTAKQGTCLLAYFGSASLAGLAVIHFVWRHPAVIGPFALMIGMPPLPVKWLAGGSGDAALSPESLLTGQKCLTDGHIAAPAI